MSSNPYNVSDELYNLLNDTAKTVHDSNYFMAKVNIIAGSATILINSVHLSVIMRKEMRQNAVYIIIMFLSLLDIITSLTTISLNFHSVWIYESTDYCYESSSYGFLVFNQIASSIIGGSSFSVPWLILLMAFYRAVAVSFPMSNLIERVTKTRNLIAVVIGIMTLESAFTTSSVLLLTDIIKRNDSDPLVDFIDSAKGRNFLLDKVA